MWDYEMGLDDFDNIDAGGGWNPGSGVDWQQGLTQGDMGITNSVGGMDNIDAGGGWNPGADVDPGMMAQLGKLFGGGASGLGGLFGGGQGGLGSLLPLLALLGGGINSNDATRKASHEMQDAAKQSNTDARALMDPVIASYAPYQAAGTKAVDSLSGMAGNNNLAGQFGGGAQKSDLAAKFKGAMSLAQLSKR